MSKGFLSIVGLILLMVVSAVTSYTQVNLQSIRRLKGDKINEQVFILKTMQAYYQSDCSNVESEEESDEIIDEYEFVSPLHTYILKDYLYLYCDNELYIEFILDEQGCEYLDYVQH